MRIQWLLLTVLSLAFTLHSAEKEIPESLAVISAHPLMGGRNVYIHKDGTLWTQVVSPPRKNETGLQEKVYRSELDSTAWEGLLKVLDDNKFSEMKSSEGPGVPDEARFSVTVGYGPGKTRSVWKWSGEKDRPFSTVRDAILRMGKSAEKLKPVIEGPFNFRWRPPGFPGGEAGAGTQFDDVPKNYDTILVGKVKEVFIRSADIEDPFKYAVTLTVTELLQGSPFPDSKVTIFIHSPSREFGAYGTLDNLNGRNCVYALKRKGDTIVSVHQPFLFHGYKPEDLALLKHAVQNHKSGVGEEGPKISDTDQEALWKLLSSTKDVDRRKALEVLRPQIKEGMRADEALKLFPADFFSKTPQDDGKTKYEAYIGGAGELMYYRIHVSAQGEVVSFGFHR